MYHLKSRLREIRGIREHTQRLLYKAVEMDDLSLLGEYCTPLLIGSNRTERGGASCLHSATSGKY